MSIIKIAGHQIEIGERKHFEIPVATLFDYTKMSIPVEVIRGAKDGPVMFISGSIHGDEVIGAEIVKRLLTRKELSKVRGTLICIPIVNPFGYNNNIRYLPDRRDLNRCFPGSPGGSMAARMAHTFLHEIVAKCQYGIDIHSASVHRTNFPQMRLEIHDDEEMRLARAFGAPIIIHSPFRTGTLRKSASDLGVKTLLFEGGEALRFDENSINVALHGILNVMREIGMLKKHADLVQPVNIMVAKSSHWIRADESGSLRTLKRLGEFVQKKELLGVISDPLGRRQVPVHAMSSGVIIGAVTMPLVNRGNALYHIATLDEMKFGTDVSENIVLDKDIDIENEDWFIEK
jgi:predicted deacylase